MQSWSLSGPDYIHLCTRLAGWLVGWAVTDVKIAFHDSGCDSFCFCLPLEIRETLKGKEKEPDKPQTCNERKRMASNQERKETSKGRHYM